MSETTRACLCCSLRFPSPSSARRVCDACRDGDQSSDWEIHDTEGEVLLDAVASLEGGIDV